MKKIIATITSLGILGLLLWALPASAKNERPKGLEDRGPLTKITFIHYKRGNAKPPWAGGGNGKGEAKCYDFLAKGAKWKTPEPYSINTLDSDGMEPSFVADAVNRGVSEWEAYGGDNIFAGLGSINDSIGYNNGDRDGYNTTSFGAYSNPGVIAVTTVWGYFSGPPRSRELIEWDILFNNASSWTWGNVDDDHPSLMDFENIAVHELGHSAGMGDLYEVSCDTETMYGYSKVGEINKRNLDLGDIQGIQELYK